MTNAAILTIGDELLIGQVVDTNSSWIGQELNKIGVKVITRIAVGDDEGEIIDGLNKARSNADIILVTGGLGPTKDDITKYTLCKYFSAKLIVNEEVLKEVKGFFEKLKRPMPDSNLRQAELPDNCEVIHNKRGTAPGMWFEPDNKIFVSLPGVPHEMKGMMTDYVLPRLKKKFSGAFIIHKTIMTAGMGESLIAEKIAAVEDSLPAHIKLAYLPNLSLVRLRLTGHGDNESQLQDEINFFAKKIMDTIPEIIYSTQDTPLEKIIGEMLTEKKATLSTAESCTGGYIAHRITSAPGSSNYFTGSIVSYSNEMKEKILQVKKETLEKFGAVSEETVREMAHNVRQILNTDFSIATSGIAGPDGGSDEKPVGTVWIAVANSKETVTKKLYQPRDRQLVIEITSSYALLELKKLILKA